MEDQRQIKAVAVAWEKQVTGEVRSLKVGNYRSEDAAIEPRKVHKVDLSEKRQVEVTAET